MILLFRISWIIKWDLFVSEFAQSNPLSVRNVLLGITPAV